MHALVWLIAIMLVGVWGPPPPPGAPSVAFVVAPAPAGSFRWPLDGPPRVVRRFDPPPRPWLPGHRGVDLAAQAGVPVRAAGAGTVYFAGQVAGRGVVSVDHPGGLRTTYEPLEPTVRAGQAVAAGDQIGTLAAGHPGCSVAACLHWGLRRGEEYLDPLALLGLGRVRLLPLAPPAAASIGRWVAVGGDRPAGVSR
jgi:murein DD-endopeptidase MepM/ murein hydrolase activator NlpD